MKSFLKVLLWILALIAVIAGAFLLFLTLTEFDPDPVIDADLSAPSTSMEFPQDTFTVVSWNVGYCGLGPEADFVMDGGTKNGTPATRELFQSYLDGVTQTLPDLDADAYLLQEVDLNSARSYNTDEVHAFESALDAQYAYAKNYVCSFVPFPWPPIGKVESGVETLTDFPIRSAERIALPCPFSWPLRVANLKRCMLVSYVELPDTDKRLVLVNLHLEAYDDGEGKAAQTRALVDFISAEYEKGNYVIAGGDFNQTFPGGLEAYPLSGDDIWTPGTLDESAFPKGFKLCYDLTVPSCRSLERPYDGAEDFNFYLIDGFIISPNLSCVSVEGVDMGFQYSDHNPVKLTVEFKTGIAA